MGGVSWGRVPGLGAGPRLWMCPHLGACPGEGVSTFRGVSGAYPRLGADPGAGPHLGACSGTCPHLGADPGGRVPVWGRALRGVSPRWAVPGDHGVVPVPAGPGRAHAPHRLHQHPGGQVSPPKIPPNPKIPPKSQNPCLSPPLPPLGAVAICVPLSGLGGSSLPNSGIWGPHPNFGSGDFGDPLESPPFLPPAPPHPKILGRAGVTSLPARGDPKIRPGRADLPGRLIPADPESPGRGN